VWREYTEMHQKLVSNRGAGWYRKSKK
jgi:hypothetical protein